MVTGAALSVLNSVSLSQIYSMERKTMQEHVQDKVFWLNKCSVAIGMWPLGKSYDKAARYTPAQFKAQFQAAVALSPRYVWLFTDTEQPGGNSRPRK